MGQTKYAKDQLTIANFQKLSVPCHQNRELYSLILVDTRRMINEFNGSTAKH